MLHWDSHGAGEPVLMIMGLGGSSDAWARLLPYVRDGHRAITFDNRGTGRSADIRGPLTMGGMVADALSVLEAAGEESAHVVGISMGGMIAQHLALEHRERVRSLVLACTTAVGMRGRPPVRMLAASTLRPLLGPKRTWELVKPALYAEHTRREHPERIREDLRIRNGRPTPSLTFLAQLAAIPCHDTRKRLAELGGLGVTIIHGEDDALVPPARADELASAIPGADLVMIPACGHMLTTDAEQQSADAVLAHLARHASPPSSLAA
jgi:pimeloyl-ACP methyl ester carboxylesterase